MFRCTSRQMSALTGLQGRRCLLALLLFSCSYVEGFSFSSPKTDGLNVKEPSYVINLHASAAEFEAKYPGITLSSASMPMSTKTGAQYQCYLPDIGSSTKEGDSLVDRSEHQRLNAIHLTSTQKRRLLLEAAAAVGIREEPTPPCLIFRAGYWAYEVCPSNYVRMFHISDNSEDPQRLLGSYSRLQDDFKPLFAEHLERLQKEGVEGVEEIPAVAYTQNFVGGDGDSAKVQYICSRSSDALIHVTGDPEGQIAADLSLNPTFLVTSPSICSVDWSIKAAGTPAGLVADVKKYLEPLLESETCVKKTEGWWTYEVCLGRYIRQFHRNSDGIISSEYVLGEFDEATNDEMAKSGSAISVETWVATGQEHSHRVYVEKYSGGTHCSETQVPRSTKLLLFCAHGNHHYILSVKEEKTCTYTVHLATPLLCAHSAFHSNRKAKESQPPLAVHCVPTIPKGGSASKIDQTELDAIDLVSEVEVDELPHITTKRVTH